MHISALRCYKANYRSNQTQTKMTLTIALEGLFFPLAIFLISEFVTLGQFPNPEDQGFADPATRHYAIASLSWVWSP